MKQLLRTVICITFIGSVSSFASSRYDVAVSSLSDELEVELDNYKEGPALVEKASERRVAAAQPMGQNVDDEIPPRRRPEPREGNDVGGIKDQGTNIRDQGTN